MELIDWITLAVFFALGCSIGWRTSAMFYTSMFKQLIQELGISNEQLLKVAKANAIGLGPDADAKIKEIEDRINEDGLEKIEIKVEKHSDTLYAFRKDNDQFLGQGSTKDALVEAMGQRLKNVRLIVVEGNEYMKSEA